LKTNPKGKSNIPLSIEVTSAVREAFQILDSMTDEDYRPQIETTRAIIFNSRIWGLLLAKHYADGKAPVPDEIRKREPRLGHELLGFYYGDLCMRDRLYNYRKYTPTNSFPGYLIHGIVLTPEVTITRFMKRSTQLKQMLSDYG
jgi:hypothetical protein